MSRRICTDVIKEMLNVIPKDKKELIKDLEWNYEDASYKAPEENFQWIRTSQTLLNHIPIPTQEWEFQVLSIYSTRNIDQIKEYYENLNKTNETNQSSM